MTLSDRIRTGEKAIAQAKAQGRDVRDWERHLAQLKRLAQKELSTLEELTAPYSLNNLKILNGKNDEILTEVHRVKIVFGGRVLQ
jgi:hypothetical protein